MFTETQIKNWFIPLTALVAVAMLVIACGPAAPREPGNITVPEPAPPQGAPQAEPTPTTEPRQPGVPSDAEVLALTEQWLKANHSLIEDTVADLIQTNAEKFSDTVLEIHEVRKVAKELSEGELNARIKWEAMRADVRRDSGLWDVMMRGTVEVDFDHERQPYTLVLTRTRFFVWGKGLQVKDHSFSELKVATIRTDTSRDFKSYIQDAANPRRFEGQLVEPTPTIRPTTPPLPPGSGKPTLTEPTYTPFPTLAPDPTPDQNTAIARESSSDLADEVTKYVEKGMTGGTFKIICRVTVTGHRFVEKDTTLDWPEEDPLYYDGPDGTAIPYYFQDVSVTECYHGELPETYSLIELKVHPEPSLEIDQDYIVFLNRTVVPDTAPEGVGSWRFNEEQLEAFGGIAGIAKGHQLWAIDGDTAWKTPATGGIDFFPGSSLADAKATGDSMPVSELLAAIEAGRE